MEEIKDLHTTSLEWGCVCNLIDKISSIEEEIEGHWDELLNMVADMVTEESAKKDPAEVFFDVYQYDFFADIHSCQFVYTRSAHITGTDYGYFLNHFSF